VIPRSKLCCLVLFITEAQTLLVFLHTCAQAEHTLMKPQHMLNSPWGRKKKAATFDLSDHNVLASGCTKFRNVYVWRGKS